MKTFLRVIFASFHLLIPLLIILTVIRVCLSPLFIQTEYSLPGFPVDDFGFTKQERFSYADKTRQYLLGEVTESDLQGIEIKTGIPLFAQREVDHLRDVKNLTSVAVGIWFSLIMVFFLTFYTARSQAEIPAFISAIRNGCAVLLGFVLLTAVAIILDFNALFTAFHKLFFTGDSWLFFLDDSLIRLFPLLFWTHLFIAIATASALLALVGLILSNRFLKNQVIR